MTPMLSPGPFSRDFEWGLATSLFPCLPTMLSLGRMQQKIEGQVWISELRGFGLS